MPPLLALTALGVAGCARELEKTPLPRPVPSPAQIAAQPPTNLAAGC
jgi:hypothetical protein